MTAADILAATAPLLSVLHPAVESGDIAAAAALADLCQEHDVPYDGLTHYLHCAGHHCRMAVRRAAHGIGDKGAAFLREAVGYLNTHRDYAHGGSYAA